MALCVTMIGCHAKQKHNAEKGAKAWAKSMGITPSGIVCASQDSDGDGYVSCTIAQKSKNGTITPTAIECAAAFSLSEGCRMPKTVIRQR